MNALARWTLRSGWHVFAFICVFGVPFVAAAIVWPPFGKRWDAAIDAALSASARTTGGEG